MNRQPELQYRDLLRAELQEVESQLLEITADVPPPVVTALRNVIGSGGKRLRPALGLLSAHLCAAPLSQAIPVAAGIEMLHTATLIHDDLIDQALVRRGRPTLNAQWSPAATVLAGDLAFARAAVLAARGKNLPLMERFSETLEIICSGELQQLFGERGRLPTREEYERRIFAKTASLFALTLEIGPRLAAATSERIAALANFGMLLGRAFQIADDVLDFVGDSTTVGKPVGSDLQQGLVTLPAILYLEQHPEDDRLPTFLRAPGRLELLHAFIADLRTSQAIEAAMAIAEHHIEKALEMLSAFPPSPYRDAMEEIARFAIHRPY